MDEKDIKAGPVETVKRMIGALNAHDIEEFLTHYADTFVGNDVGLAEPTIGRQGMRTVISEYMQAFPDLVIRQEKVMVHPDEIILFWSAVGTQMGSIMHIPPSGRRVEVRGVTSLRVDRGEITRGDTIWDVAGMLRAIGLLPELR